VPVKLFLYAGLSMGGPAERAHWGFEFPAAQCTRQRLGVIPSHLTTLSFRLVAGLLFSAMVYFTFYFAGSFCDAAIRMVTAVTRPTISASPG